jgi:hypothetical protein
MAKNRYAVYIAMPGFMPNDSDPDDFGSTSLEDARQTAKWFRDSYTGDNETFHVTNPLRHILARYLMDGYPVRYGQFSLTGECIYIQLMRE